MKSAIFALSLLLLVSISYAQQPISFGQAKKHLVELHQANPDVTTFYCGCRIGWIGKKGVPDAESCGYEPRKTITNSGKKNIRATRIEWEHVMPAYWFGHQLQCWQEGGRKACRAKGRFRQMEADMHNLQPTIGELNGDRSNYRFAMLEGESRKYGACDFEVDFKQKKAEPPPNVRGDIARTHFYMAERYGLKLSKQQLRMFEAWNKIDPVDGWERERNELVTEIQGSRNSFIH